MTTYNHNFYANRHEATKYAAETILSLLLKEITPVTSAVDMGCGVGTWLSVLQDKGVDIQGYDGPWVNPELLEIPKENFKTVDLHKLDDSLLPPIQYKMPGGEIRALNNIVTRRYDLAICLEVAEHLPSYKAGWLVTCLTGMADTVLFSAAIPGQGGTEHVNEQWPSYWAKLFAEHGYQAVDCIRSKVWGDTKIPIWYRQNTLLFMKGAPVDTPLILDLVHPELYMSHEQPGVKGNFTRLVESVGRYVKG